MIPRNSAGSGTSTIQLPFYNTGTVSASSGTLRFERGGILFPSSVLQFFIGGDMAGSQFGQIAMSGVFQLGGNLGVSLTNGFVPSISSSFGILTGGTRKGGFAAASGLDLGGGLYFQGIADRNGLSLVTKSSVVPAPPLAINLVNQIVAFGDTAVFGFSPPGVEPCTYQWTFFGTNLPGQTNPSLILTNVQLGSLGMYCALVADAFNVMNTYCATLSATNPPSISGQPSGLTTNSGANIHVHNDCWRRNTFAVSMAL